MTVTADTGLIDPKALRRALGSFATGVTVVTTGEPAMHAMTANSFTSVSLDPPLVLVCVDHSAVMHRCLEHGGAFGVSILSADQEQVGRHFADRWRPLGPAQFDTVGWRPGPATGVPLITGSLATFECEQWRVYDGGDHTIFLGKVVSFAQDDDEGLLFFRGGFRTLAPGATA